ncbi:Periplasmic serine endoprotease DegP precursor [Botrimarina colliarenosi]|uniref:Periplasmic serine endoprotease DegP n=1 Tax=Botrimarina colliarenosi TaxID=2528001 RepID=A0A5C6AFP7_9BACT|nr:trypsin-like peptidase domain-containing protein [Botrimarina colliarenosi]TWT97033.1 Periplasmic serine endoprotease DegP precursor [Botrimarina colliarenosi]
MYSIVSDRPGAPFRRFSRGVAGSLLVILLASAGLTRGEEGASTPAPDAPTAVQPATNVAKSPSDGSLPMAAELEAALQPGPPSTVEQLRLLQQQVRRVVARARPVTVSVEMNDSVGSGVIVSADGLVLTAGHVSVEPNREVMIRFPDGHRVKGRSLGVNHPIDSGLVQITDSPPASEDGKPGAWPFLPIAEVAPQPGDWTVALGQPNGFVDGRAPPVRLGRVLTVSDDLINTDATLVGGDSGGPLINLRGEVIAIHSKIGEQITSNYHVAVGAYRREWQRLMEGRMTGVPDGEDPDDWRPMAGLALRQTGDGLVVTQVFPRRAAAEAGVTPGDVLLEVAGKEPESLAAVDRLIRRQEAFSRVPLVVQRDGVKIELTLWLGRAPTDFPGASFTEDPR